MSEKLKAVSATLKEKATDIDQAKDEARVCVASQFIVKLIIFLYICKQISLFWMSIKYFDCIPSVSVMNLTAVDEILLS